jgi:methionyl-tRNA synthetase
LIRTTDPRHRRIVEQFFARVEASGDIVEGRQQGWYCVACEEFKDDPATAQAPDCPIHQRPLEWRDEVNLFFRLSRYQQQIESLIAQPGFIQPASRRNEVENFVRQGLRDFSISRVNLPWGIPVPGHDGHTFYVWFDALLGYITALLEEGDACDRQGHPALPCGVLAGDAALRWASPAQAGVWPWLPHPGGAEDGQVAGERARSSAVAGPLRPRCRALVSAA